MSVNGKSVHVNREYDPEYRLKDFIFHLLYRWRSILLAVLLCAAVIGGLKAISANAAHQAGNKTKDELRYEQDMEAYRKEVANAQKKLKKNRDVLNERLAYREGSLLMQLDPGNVWIAEKKYLVSDAAEKAADVVAVYTGAMIADHDEAALEDAFGTSNAGYVNEVVTITADSEENAFRVKAEASTEEAAEKGLAYAVRKIEEAEKNAQAVGQHTLLAADEGVSRQILADLTKLKNDLNDDINKYTDKVKTSERNLKGAEENEPLRPGNPAVRGALTGAGLGLLAMLGLYLITFVRRSRLKKGDELTEQYGVPLFGEMERSGARKPEKGIDGLLEKLEFGKKPITEEQVYDNAAVLVRENREEGTLLLAGTVGEDVLGRVKAEMAKRLGEEMVIGTLAGFPAGSGAAEEVCRAGAVLWVEEKNVSRNDGIRKAAEMLETAGAKVIGALVV